MRACPQCLSSTFAELEFCPLDGAALYEAQVDPLIGQSLGRYRVEALLGRGAMGSVYRAYPEALDRAFAVKVLHADMACDRKLVERFAREAHALSQIRHSNIVSVIDFVTTESGLCALVMEYLPGIDLAERLAEAGPLPVDQLRRIARGVAMGLNEAHRLKLIHRDIKPSNVRLVTEDGHEIPKLVDFGVVRLEDQPDAQRLTGQNHLVGTPRYMAPEMVMGEAITAAVDLYALGVMMHEMATGAAPFVGQTTADVLVKQATEAPPPLPPLEGIERLILALMAKDAADRPKSAIEVVAWIDSPPSIAPASIAPAPPIARRWPYGLAAFVATLVVTLFLAIGPSTEPEPIAEVVVPSPPVTGSVAKPPPAPAKAAAKRTRTPSRQGRADLDAAERRLGTLLAQRGLTRADLSGIKLTKKSYRRWRRARARKRTTTAGRAVQALLTAVPKVKLGPGILERRLDRLLTAIRGSRREVPQVLMQEINQRYFELRVQAKEARTNSRFARVSKRISALEAKLRKYRYGD